MKYYETLIEKGCFSRQQLIDIVKKPSTANNIIYEYQKNGLIEKVRRDFYVVMSLETKQPILSRYEIGSKLFPDAYISHHTAFEVYGYGNQVFYECFVATEKRFNEFEYNGVIYRRVERKPNVKIVNRGKVTVSSIEQTVVDSIRDCEKIAGLEEVIRCIMLIPTLNEEELLECISKCNNGFLFQKCGYIFEELNDEFHFSSKFFEICEERSSKAKKYLLAGLRDNVFQDRWKLYTPSSLKRLIDKGVGDIDAIR